MFGFQERWIIQKKLDAQKLNFWIPRIYSKEKKNYLCKI